MKKHTFIIIFLLTFLSAFSQFDSTKYIGTWRLSEKIVELPQFKNSCERKFPISDQFEIQMDSVKYHFHCDSLRFRVLPGKWYSEKRPRRTSTDCSLDSMRIVIEAFIITKILYDGTRIDVSDSILLDDKRVFIFRQGFSCYNYCSKNDTTTLNMWHPEFGDELILEYIKVK